MAEEKKYEKLAEQWKEWEKKNEEARALAEKEWREAWQKDAAGHLLGVVQYIEAQIGTLQNQLDAAYPLGVAQRSIEVLVENIGMLDQRIAKLEIK